MFIRKKPTPNSPRKTVQIVENIRIGLRVRQSILAYVGVIMNEEDEVKIMALAKLKVLEIIKERSAKSGRVLSDDEAKDLTKRGRKKTSLLPDKHINEDLSSILAENLEEEYRIIDGVNDIASGVFDGLGLNNILRSDKQATMLKDVILTRMVFSQSKLQLCKTMKDKFDKQYNEDQIYRMMDKIYPRIDKIKQIIFNKTHALMPNVKVLLFDVTTLYCESQIKDGLREFGFSKDGKFNNTQLVLALATNELGLPIGYELFPGNCAEVKTLLFAIRKWSKLFEIKNVCFIGDRAMFSEDNISLIEEHGYQYIIAAKLKVLSQDMKHKILDKTNYTETTFGDEDGLIGEFAYPNKIKQIRCELNGNNIGYNILGEKNAIIGMEYIAPDGTKTIALSTKIAPHLAELNELACYTKSCICVLLSATEYELLKDDAITFKDTAIIVDYDIIYNGEKIDTSKLSNTKQNKIINAAITGKISSLLMEELFGDKYSSTTMINVACSIVADLFPNYKIPVRRLCVSFKESRAHNDEIKRSRILETLKPKQGSANNVLNTPAKMYMSTNGTAVLDEIKISGAEQWDGIHGVITNITTDNPQDILSRYGSLWRIEEAFRINKHNLGMRPIYHYKAERIHTHIAICYIAFTLLKLIQYQTQLTQSRLTINNIIATLLSVESSIMVDHSTNIRYRFLGNMSSDAKTLYQAFGVKRCKSFTIYK